MDVARRLRLNEWPLASPWVIARRICEVIPGASAASFARGGRCLRRAGPERLAPTHAVDVSGALLAVQLPHDGVHDHELDAGWRAHRDGADRRPDAALLGTAREVPAEPSDHLAGG